MSRVVQVNGSLGPVLSGLGEHVAQRTSGGYVASRYGANMMRNGRGVNPCALFISANDAVNVQVPRSGSLAPWPVQMQACGGDGMPCMDGSPVASLAGLGDVSNWTCPSWASIMTQLEALLARAETMNLTQTPEYVGARSYFNSTSGAFQKPIISCSEHTEAVTKFYNALNARLGSPSAPPLVNSTGPFNLDDNTSTVIKWVAIGAVAIAGAYALGPIFRGIGGLIPKGRK